MYRFRLAVLILGSIAIVACVVPTPNFGTVYVTQTIAPPAVTADPMAVTTASAAATTASAAATSASAAATNASAAATIAALAILSPTATVTSIPTHTPAAPTRTAVPTLTHTPTATPTRTATPTSTPTPTATATVTTSDSIVPPPFAAIEDEMVQAINTQRLQAGLPVYRADVRLAEAARGHALDMATRNYYSHVTPEGKTLRDRLALLGLNPQRAGENFYVTSGEPGQVTSKTMEWFMGDPPHRDNLLHEHYTRVGVGVARTANGLYVVVVDLTGE